MSDQEDSQTNRGRAATHPKEIGKRGWKDVLVRVKGELSRDNVSLVAAGVGFFGLLAAFPALTALVSIYGLFADPSDVAQRLTSLASVLPGEALNVIEQQLKVLIDQSQQTLSIGIAVGIVVALWSARQGMKAVIAACNIAYDEFEDRGFLRTLGLSIVFTLGALIFVVLATTLGAIVPAAAHYLLGDTWAAELIALLRWPLLWLLVVLALALVYRFAPARDKPRWRWVTWGSAIAATLWVLASVLFALYVRNFGSYEETYGSIGGVIVLLMWLYITGFVVILGAEINAEMEHQTRRDTTVGPAEPLGQRGAHVADTLGASAQD